MGMKKKSNCWGVIPQEKGGRITSLKEDAKLSLPENIFELGEVVSVDIPTGLTMKEVESRLGIKQNILIYLCEKKVVVPDVEDPPKGRGHVRRFSEFNVFEFAIALEMKKYNIKVGYIAIIMRILRKFFQYAAKDVGFKFENFRKDKTLPLLFLVIMDGEFIFFRIHTKNEDKLVPGVNFTKLSESLKIGALDEMGKGMFPNLLWWQYDALWNKNKMLKIPKDALFNPQEHDLNSYSIKLEVNLNKIAWGI